MRKETEYNWAYIPLSEVEIPVEHLEYTFKLYKDHFSVTEQVLLESRYGFNGHPMLPYTAIEVILANTKGARQLPRTRLYVLRFNAALKLKGLARRTPEHPQEKELEFKDDPVEEFLVALSNTGKGFSAESDLDDLRVIVREVDTEDPEKVLAVHAAI